MPLALVLKGFLARLPVDRGDLFERNDRLSDGVFNSVLTERLESAEAIEPKPSSVEEELFRDKLEC